jgi:Ca2+-binding EF-hand superfamily protein
MVGYSNEVNEQRIANIFNNFDRRKKGELDYDEIRMFLFEVFDELEEDTSQLHGDDIIRELLELFDYDKNGLINYIEFTKLVEFLILEKGLRIY